MEYDVVVDPDNYSDFMDGIEELQSTIDSNIDYIYTAIDGLEEGWTGSTYQTFKTKAGEYKHYLDALYQVVGIFETLLASQFEDGIYQDFLDQIEEADAALSGSGGGAH